MVRLLPSSLLARAHQRLRVAGRAATALSATNHTAPAAATNLHFTAFATTATSSFVSNASPPSAVSKTLVPDIVRHRKRRPSASVKSAPILRTTLMRTSDEQLAALGLEIGQSNAYYNQHLRAAIDRNDIDTATAIVAALHATDANASSNSIDSPVIWTRNYDVLLYAFSQRSDTKRALILLDAMVLRNRVSTRSFNTALVACSKTRALAPAMRVLAQMRAAGKTPGPFAYANAVNCCAKRKGNVGAAQQLWREMLADGIEPTVEVVNCMLRVLGRATNRSQQALAFVQDARNAFDVTPDAITVATLVQLLLRDEQFVDAVQWLEELDCVVRIEHSVLNAVLDACRQRECWTSAARIEQLVKSQHSGDKEANDEDAITAELLALCAANDAAAAPLAWSFDTPNAPISARARRNEQRKHESPSIETLQQTFRGIVAALDAVVQQQDDDSSTDAAATAAARRDARAILKRVSSYKHWERMLVASAPADVAAFMQLCNAADVALPAELRNLHLHALAMQSPVATDALVTAEQVLHELIASGQADTTSFNNVLALCSRVGRLDAADRVLALMIAEHKQPTTFSFNAALNCCAQARNATRAEALWRELERSGQRPDVVTLNTMLKTFATATQHAAQTHATQQRGRTVDTTTDDAAYTHSRRLYAKRALTLYQQSTGLLALVPTAATHFALFRVFAQEADRVAAAVERLGDVDDDDLDDVVDNNSSDTLFQLITALIQRICTTAPAAQLDIGVFNAALDVFQRAGDTRSAFDVFNAMQTRGLTPTDLTLQLLFAACSRSEQKDTGLQFLRYLMDDYAYTPTLAVLNGALELCATANAPHDALELFRGIDASGILQPNEATFVALVHAFAVAGDVEQAMAYTRELTMQRNGKASRDAYNRTLQACAVAHRPLRALEVLREMQMTQQSIAPDAVSYNMVLKAFAKGDRSLSRDDDDDDDVDSYSDDDDDNDDTSGSDDYSDGDVSDDDYSYKYGDDGDDDSDDGREILDREHVRQLLTDLLAEMRHSGVRVTSITYTRLIAACAVRGDTAGVLAFFDDLMQHEAVDALTSDSESDSESQHQLALASESSLQSYLRACSWTHDLTRTRALMTRLQLRYKELGERVSPRVVLQLLHTLDNLKAWRDAVAVLRDLETQYGTRPSAVFFTRVMRTCNAAGEFHVVEQIFETLQHATAYKALECSSESFIEAIYAAEQREQWVDATNLFVAMQQHASARGDAVPSTQLQRIALGRYSVRDHDDAVRRKSD